MDDEWSDKQREGDALFLRTVAHRTEEPGSARLRQIAERIQPSPRSIGQCNYEAWRTAFNVPEHIPWSYLDRETRTAWETAAKVVLATSEENEKRRE